MLPTPDVGVPLVSTHLPINGARLHVMQAGDPNGELVILLHGFPEFWYGWRQQIAALADAGLCVWIPDQRGYNLSEKPGGIDAYQIGTLAADVVGLIDAAGSPQAYLVGHDWGAMVAWQTAISHPERVRRLGILNVPHPFAFQQAIFSRPEQLLRSWYFGMLQIPWLPEGMFLLGDGNLAAAALTATSRPGTFTDADIAQYVQAWKQPGAATGMINWYRAVVQRRPTYTADMRVRVPTQIIWGARDAALSLSLAQASADLCDDVRLNVIETATHWVHHEEPAQVNAILTAFLK
jgi:pimeloyl-ACP methyl ester carboxylesterase